MVAKTSKEQTQVLPPVRNRTGRPRRLLTLRELTKLREMLLSKRRELLGDINDMETEIGWAGEIKTTGCMLHDGLDAEERVGIEATYGCIHADAELLREIEEVLLRMDAGNYGLCMGTGRPIDKKRLRARPWAKYCVEYTKTLENRRRACFPIRTDGSESMAVEAGSAEEELLAEALADLYEQMDRRSARCLRRLLLELDEC